jgi:hypothetical protein
MTAFAFALSLSPVLSVVLQETLYPGAVDVAGWVIALGGLALTIAWLVKLTR